MFKRLRLLQFIIYLVNTGFMPQIVFNLDKLKTGINLKDRFKTKVGNDLYPPKLYLQINFKLKLIIQGRESGKCKSSQSNARGLSPPNKKAMIQTGMHS
jgi:hypothetical protein